MTILKQSVGALIKILIFHPSLGKKQLTNKQHVLYYQFGAI